MKKLLIFLLIATTLFSFCGCETKEEKAARHAQENAEHLTDAYEQAMQNYDNLQNQLDEYNQTRDRLNGYY